MSGDRMWMRRGAVSSLSGAPISVAATAAERAGRPRRPVAPDRDLAGVLSDFLNAGDTGDADRQVRALDVNARLSVVTRNSASSYYGAGEIAATWQRARAGRSMSHFVSTFSIRRDDPSRAECYVMESVYAEDRKLMLGQGHYRLSFTVGDGDLGPILRELHAELLWANGQSMDWPLDAGA